LSLTDSHSQPLDAAREKHFLEELRRHPELMERFEAILALTRSDRCVLRSADETEELLVEEMRRLGSCTMHDWAQRAEEEAARELRENHPRVRLRKKKF
jgi:hypothetical protein